MCAEPGITSHTFYKLLLQVQVQTEPNRIVQIVFLSDQQGGWLLGLWGLERLLDPLQVYVCSVNSWGHTGLTDDTVAAGHTGTDPTASGAQSALIYVPPGVV